MAKIESLSDISFPYLPLPTERLAVSHKAIETGRDVCGEQFHLPILEDSVGPVIRTGCIPCLGDGVKCDASNPRCRRKAVSEAWRVNNYISCHHHGTWREREGVHSFIFFVLSPTRLGLPGSSFWNETVLRACFSNEAVFHVVSAIGALHHHISKQSTGVGGTDNSRLDFGLRQCNKTIKLLTAATHKRTGTFKDPGISVIICILFSCFESLFGDPAAALTHSAQGRKLLRNCEQLNSTGKGSRILDTVAVGPILGSFEIQAKARQGKSMKMTDPSELSPLPDFEEICSLAQADSILHNAYISILAFSQQCHPMLDHTQIVEKMKQKQVLFMPGLNAWKQKFGAFLFRQSNNLSHDDMQHAKILKANHLNCSILARFDLSLGRPGWESFENDFKSVVDLSASAMKTYSNPSKTDVTAFQVPFMSFGLFITEPLYICMARCPSRNLRRQAAELLYRIPRPNRGEKISMRGGVMVKTPPSNELRDTDRWSIDQWMDFAWKTRVDTGMATYFARLPSNYLDNPYMPEKRENLG